VSRQDLLLVLDDRLLIPQDLGLIPEQQVEASLIPQNLRLVSDDHPIVCDDRLLVPERRLCHWYSLLWA